MALVPKIDPNKIFASNAPSQDKPAAFDNYEKGMDETRKNLGRPTIKQSNYLHQTADQKILWIHQNGGGLPYDPSIEYAENAVTLKDGELKQFVDGAWVEVKTKALPATAITTASSQTQQVINDFGGAKWYAKVSGYELGATVKLDNGDIVKSTVAANTANPNVDMAGWNNPSEDQRIKNLDSFSFDDVLTKNEITNSSTTDLAGKLQSVSNDTSILKVILKRKYYINALVTFSRSIEFEFVGDGEFIFGAAGQIVCAGSVESKGKLSQSSTKYSNTVTLPVGTGLQANDIICVFNNADYSFSPHRANYKDGQFAKIASVTGNVATLFDILYSAYDTTCDVYKINQINVTLKNPKISVRTPSNIIPFEIKYANPKIYGLSMTGGLRYGLSLTKCYGGFSIGSESYLQNLSPDGYQYAVVLSNCQDFNMSGGKYASARHGVSFGGYSDECSVPNRNITISNAVISTTNTTGIGGADIHGNSENVKYNNCTIYHSSTGGKNISLVDCTIYGRPTLDGCCTWFSELAGGVIELKRCKLISAGTGNNLGDYGFIYAYLDKPLSEDIYFDFNDITLVAPNSTALAKFFNLTVAKDIELGKKVTISIIKPNVIAPALLTLALIRSVTGSTQKIPISKVVIDEIINCPPCSFIYSLADFDAGYKLRLMHQYGNLTLNTGDGNQSIVIGASQTLPYSYPVTPTVSLGISTSITDTWNAAFLNSGVVAAPYNGLFAAATLRLNAIQPLIQTTSNKLPANKNLVVGWAVGI